MRIALFLTVAQTFLFAIHFFVYKTIVKFAGLGSPQQLFWAKVVFFVLSVSFLAASALTYRFYGPAFRVFYSASAIWLGTLYWLFFASLFSWIVYAVGRMGGKDFSMVAQALFVLALLTSAYGVWNSYQTKIRNVTVKLEGLPAEWKGKKAVLLADTHFGNVRNAGFANKVVRLINEQQPDIVFIPGDFYDGPPADYEGLAKPFSGVTAPWGVYFAAGNHEEFADSKPLLNAIATSGVHVLDDEMTTVAGMQIVGVGYGATTHAEDEKKLLGSMGLDPQRPSILIKHAPTHIPVAEAAGISLQVSGHTHLGQVYPLRYITKNVYGKFHYGLNRMEKTQVYTTSGIGTWGPPQRVGTNSELVVITFE